MSAYQNLYFQFRAAQSGVGDTLRVLVSNTYTGYGNPNPADWTQVPVNFSGLDTNFRLYEADVTAFKNQPLFVAFRYTSNVTAASYRVDDAAMNQFALNIPKVQNLEGALSLLGEAGRSRMLLGFDAPRGGTYEISILDITGRPVYRSMRQLQAGATQIELDGFSLQGGLYVVRVSGAAGTAHTKAVVR
jgi:hypothetical protein